MMTRDEMLNEVFLCVYEEYIANYATKEEFLIAMRERWENMRRTDYTHYLIVNGNAYEEFFCLKGYTWEQAIDIDKLTKKLLEDLSADRDALIHELIEKVEKFDEEITPLAEYPILPMAVSTTFNDLYDVVCLHTKCEEKSQLDGLLLYMFNKYHFKKVHFYLTPVDKIGD